MAIQEIDYRTALGQPDYADNWLNEIETEFEKVSEELEMDITLIFPITERNSRGGRFGLHVDVNPETHRMGGSSRPWRRLPPSPGPPPNRPLPPLPVSATPRPVSLQSTTRSRSNTTSSSGSTMEETLASPVNTRGKLRDRFRLGRRSAVVQAS